MNQEGRTRGIGRYRIQGIGNLRRSSRRGRPSRMILMLTILACGAVLSAPAFACKYPPTPTLGAGFSGPHAFETQTPAQETFPSTKQDDDVSIVGFWHVLFVSGGQVFDEGYDQWHSDWTEILNDTAPPQPANGTGTICLGVYKKTGPRTYTSKHPFWSFDTTGTLVGTGVILENLIVDHSGHHYTGSFEWITYDLNGHVTSDTKGELKAKRITVD
jgi:hypothetical protein